MENLSLRVRQARRQGIDAVMGLIEVAKTEGNDLTPEDYMALGYLVTSDRELFEAAQLWGFNNKAGKQNILAYQIGAYAAQMKQDEFRGESVDRKASLLGNAFVAATSHPSEVVRHAAGTIRDKLALTVAEGLGLSGR